MDGQPTVVAVSTPPGVGGIAIVRMSGPEAVGVLSRAWKGVSPEGFASHSAHLGWIIDADGNGIDQTIATFFRGPNSYTGEDVVELSCHGSMWIQQAIVARLIECGASPAGAGEFTRRAFLNGRLDLAQAEGVADMIAASSRASARLAASQLRGDFSNRLKVLRDRLIDLGSLLELELDFSEEDVEFADRSQLISLAKEIRQTVSRLASSYKAGNAFKHGVPVAIAGVPNAGKSTLLNALVGEEKAIVSDIPGTTRDVIEDTVELGGILFRFFDTAGLRKSEDTVENIGIERARKKIEEAAIVVALYDPTQPAEPQKDMFSREIGGMEAKKIVAITKQDSMECLEANLEDISNENRIVRLSAKTGKGLDQLKEELVRLSTSEFNPEQELIVTNARHFEAFRLAEAPLERLIEGLESGVSADFLSQDLREVEHHLGAITGEVSSTDILHTIFARYCIGK